MEIGMPLIATSARGIAGKVSMGLASRMNNVGVPPRRITNRRDDTLRPFP